MGFKRTPLQIRQQQEEDKQIKLIAFQLGVPIKVVREEWEKQKTEKVTYIPRFP